VKSRKVRGIARDTLKFILEASRSSLPAEFAGLLQVENEIITEVLILPGTENSRMSALIRLYMLPNMQVAGSAHSHPSGFSYPPNLISSSSLAPETITSSSVRLSMSIAGSASMQQETGVTLPSWMWSSKTTTLRAMTLR